MVDKIEYGVSSDFNANAPEVVDTVPGTNVTVTQLQENVRAEDEERARLRNSLIFAVAFVKDYIHRDGYPESDNVDLTDDEKVHFDLAVLFSASDFYMSANGGGRNNASGKYTGLNAILDLLKLPQLGTEVRDDG